MPETAKKTAAPTNRTAAAKPDVWTQLSAPFPPDQIEKLPKVLRRDDQDKGRCNNDRYSADGHYCGGYHARAMHLDYVGHAGITMRLNEVVGPDGWSWEPMATDSDGLPVMSTEFWIKLTVNGVTKYGVGDDFGRSSKQAIGDALRNAAMRFGIATYLWSKSDAALAMKRATDDVEPAPAPQAQETRPEPPTGPGADLLAELNVLTPETAQMVRDRWPFPGRGPLDLDTAEEVAQVRALVDGILQAGNDPWAPPAQAVTPGPGASGDQPPS